MVLRELAGQDVAKIKAVSEALAKFESGTSKKNPEGLVLDEALVSLCEFAVYIRHLSPDVRKGLAGLIHSVDALKRALEDGVKLFSHVPAPLLGRQSIQQKLDRIQSDMNDFREYLDALMAVFPRKTRANDKDVNPYPYLLAASCAGVLRDFGVEETGGKDGSIASLCRAIHMITTGDKNISFTRAANTVKNGKSFQELLPKLIPIKQRASVRTALGLRDRDGNLIDPFNTTPKLSS